MQSRLNDKITYCLGDEEILERLIAQPAYDIFSAESISFLESFSEQLMRNPLSRKYPDVFTLGFWCRKAALKTYRDYYKTTDGIHMGLGVAFHISPSNVAVNFAYSLVSSMLAGNANVIRIPSKEFPQIDIILEALQKTISQHRNFRDRIVIVRYERDRYINDYLSSICDLRVIWGGDNTISELRKSPIRPRAREVCFADRNSICVIDAKEYLKNGEFDEVAHDFYNDTYLSDQNACTSPKLVVWFGTEADARLASEKFWDALADIVDRYYEISAEQIISKISAAYELAARNDNNCKFISAHNGSCRLCRMKISKIDDMLLEFDINSGLFLEFTTENLADILLVCTKKLQTVATYGIAGDEWKNLIYRYHPAGIDRVVPIGHTMDFDLRWDGYDLIEAMSRGVVER